MLTVTGTITWTYMSKATLKVEITVHQIWCAVTWLLVELIHTHACLPASSDWSSTPPVTAGLHCYGHPTATTVDPQNLPPHTQHDLH